MIAVTTFSPEGYREYGRQFLESFVKHWPCKLLCYVEEEPDFKHENILYRHIMSVDGLIDFLNIAPRHPHYMYNAYKFSFKCFAQFDAFTWDDKVFWVDADVITDKDIPIDFLEGLVEGVPFCFLGRDTYTETGFLGFNTKHKDFPKFRKNYENQYKKKYLFRQPFYTDCHAFDAARVGIEGRNLTPWGRGVQHVFVDSVLGEYMDHLKGPRKAKGYSPERDNAIQPVASNNTGVEAKESP